MARREIKKDSNMHNIDKGQELDKKNFCVIPQ